MGTDKSTSLLAQRGTNLCRPMKPTVDSLVL